MEKKLYGHRAKNVMNTDIKETDDNYQIEMELPGFTREDVKADLKDGTLTIEASHSENKDENNGDYDSEYQQFQILFVTNGSGECKNKQHCCKSIAED